jgi:hypothetical protein
MAGQLSSALGNSIASLSTATGAVDTLGEASGAARAPRAFAVSC